MTAFKIVLKFLSLSWAFLWEACKSVGKVCTMVELWIAASKVEKCGEYECSVGQCVQEL